MQLDRSTCYGFRLSTLRPETAKVGMLSKCKDKPSVRSMIASANAILGYDLLEAKPMPLSCTPAVIVR